MFNIYWQIAGLSVEPKEMKAVDEPVAKKMKGKTGWVIFLLCKRCVE